MDIILIYKIQWNLLDVNFMQTHHWRLKYYAANIVFPCIWMNTIQNFGLMEMKLSHKNTPPPKPYGPDFYMQNSPNIIILLGGLNVKL